MHQYNLKRQNLTQMPWLHSFAQPLNIVYMYIYIRCKRAPNSRDKLQTRQKGLTLRHFS